MNDARVYLGLDIGERRIGLARGDSIGRIAQPLRALPVDGHEGDYLRRIIADEGIQELVAGFPRNMSGQPTDQTAYSQAVGKKVLEPLGLPLHWQDESLTSIMAEERLLARGKPYTKGDVDAEAASIILQDFLDKL
ncbi:MAG TPA: Holliday junction resolvase RuvX [Candidatus Saccharimonadales bacterium]|nr:Holliday junction resolvase RuvX [Candidatus Saccharimonadales bacterium]